MLAAESAVLFELELIRSALLVLRRRIISPLTLCAGQRYNVSHRVPPAPASRAEFPYTQPGIGLTAGPFYSKISEMTPAPTVRPPSRMAKRSSFSIAIGVISSAVSDTLSPGITISTPSGNWITPVTSVVRK